MLVNMCLVCLPCAAASVRPHMDKTEFVFGTASALPSVLAASLAAALSLTLALRVMSAEPRRISRLLNKPVLFAVHTLWALAMHPKQPRLTAPVASCLHSFAPHAGPASGALCLLRVIGVLLTLAGAPAWVEWGLQVALTVWSRSAAQARIRQKPLNWPRVQGVLYTAAAPHAGGGTQEERC